MSTYAAIADVQARMPTRVINATSMPNTVQVQAWLDETEARLNGALQAAQLPAPYTAAPAVLILRTIVTDAVEGQVRIRYATAGGAHDDPDGQKLVDDFKAIIRDILANPTVWGGQLGAGAAPDSARRLRSHVLDNADGLTIANGDFAPQFTRQGGTSGTATPPIPFFNGSSTGGGTGQF